MTTRSWMLLGAVGVAVWVLATHTLGQTVRGGSSDVAVGFAVAALAVVCVHVLQSLRVPEALAGRMAGWLIGGGVACVLLSLALQIYLASQASENARRAAEVMADAARAGQRMSDVNIRANFPESVAAIGYLCLLIGAAMVFSGVRVGMSGWSALPTRMPTEGGRRAISVGPDAEPGAAADGGGTTGFPGS